MFGPAEAPGCVSDGALVADLITLLQCCDGVLRRRLGLGYRLRLAARLLCSYRDRFFQKGPGANITEPVNWGSLGDLTEKSLRSLLRN